jgi:hypothetical protein
MKEEMSDAKLRWRDEVRMSSWLGVERLLTKRSLVAWPDVCNEVVFCNGEGVLFHAGVSFLYSLDNTFF